jgi:SAM-dependent methyltransferase
MFAEFNDVAGWTADAVEQLGEQYAIPAACRGSSSPSTLAWLAETCELATGTVLLDVGAGAGGPAAWAAERYGVRPILLEPMLTACAAAARLFGLPVIAADGARIPLRTGSVDAAWCLGVLCTVENKAALLSEIRRVLKPGGPLGLLVVIARTGRRLVSPDGNHFPTQDELAALLTDTGFTLVEQIGQPEGAPLSWSRRVERVTAAVAARHRSTPAHALAVRQGERLDRLFASRQISTRLIHAVSRSPGGRRTRPRWRDSDITGALDDPNSRSWRLVVPPGTTRLQDLA